MKVTGNLHAPTALIPTTETPLRVQQEAEWYSKPFWLLRRGDNLYPYWESNYDLSVFQLVIHSKELFFYSGSRTCRVLSIQFWPDFLYECRSYDVTAISTPLLRVLKRQHKANQRCCIDRRPYTYLHLLKIRLKDGDHKSWIYIKIFDTYFC